MGEKIWVKVRGREREGGREFVSRVTHNKLNKVNTWSGSHVEWVFEGEESGDGGVMNRQLKGEGFEVTT